MRQSWETKRLGEVCRFVRGPFGGSLKKDIFVKDGFAVYEQQHAIYDQFNEIRYFIDEVKFKEMQRFELHPNDLIMSCSGTMGKVAIAPSNIRQGIINQALLKLTPSKAILPEFLKYWMNSDDFQHSLKEQAGGVAIQNVASVGVLKEIEISLPPLSEQQRIVGILDEAFDGIATAKANAEKNRQNARALFESHLQAVFTQRGDGWVEKRLGDLAESISTGPFGTMVHKADYVADGIPMINPMNIIGSRVVPSDKMRVSSKTRDRLSRYVLKKGDIVIGRRGEMGRCALITEKEAGWLCGTGSFFIRLPQELDGKFFVALFSSKGFKTKLEENSVGTTMNNLNHSILESLPILLPPHNVQEAIIERAEKIENETQRLESIYQQKLAALDELKQALLHQAFSGEL